MNVKSEKTLTLQTKFAECAYGDYIPSKVCDASIVKMVSQDVDQIVDQIEK